MGNVEPVKAYPITNAFGGCTPTAADGEPAPIEAGAVTATGPVTATGGITAGAVNAGDVTAGEVVAGGVVAGDVVAGDVQAGIVQAGTVQAADVSAGDVLAGDIAAGDVTATGPVELTGPINATIGLGLPVANTQVVVSQCNPNGGCGSLDTEWTAAIQGACAGGIVAGFQAYPNQIDAVNTFHTLIALVECP